MTARGGSTDRRKAASPATRNAVAGGGNGGVAENLTRLRLNPNKDHKPESYEGLELDYCPSIFSSMERHLPTNMLNAPRNHKVNYITNILRDYLSPAERSRDQKHREYRHKIQSNYLPLHRELYTLNPTTFFVPSFLKAISDNTEQSFRRIVSEPSPGIFTFEMLQPRFCELLLSEVENFEKWVKAAKFQIMRPSTINKYGVVLDDIGFKTMLAKLMEGFICPLSEVFFAEVGGSTLDSHHGYIVEYGKGRDVDSGFHVDDSEVSLNVCLGTQFSGGELFFRGMRCNDHLNTASYSEEIYDYFHSPGRAVLHHGCLRHGARATTSGHRVNLILWCRSSVFRESRRYRKDFSGLCAVCNHEKQEKLRSYATTRLGMFGREGGTAA